MTLEATHEAAGLEPAPDSSGSGIPPVAWIIFLTGMGYGVCVTANTLSRMTEAAPQVVFWAGMLLIAVPIFSRLTSSDASDRERLFLVCLLGGALYGLKIARDPLMYTFPDEF